MGQGLPRRICPHGAEKSVLFCRHCEYYKNKKHKTRTINPGSTEAKISPRVFSAHLMASLPLLGIVSMDVEARSDEWIEGPGGGGRRRPIRLDAFFGSEASVRGRGVLWHGHWIGDGGRRLDEGSRGDSRVLSTREVQREDEVGREEIWKMREIFVRCDWANALGSIWNGALKFRDEETFHPEKQKPINRFRTRKLTYSLWMVSVPSY